MAKRRTTSKATKTANRKRARKPASQPVVFIDIPPPSPLRGILPTPPEVEALVERELKDHPVSDTERQRVTDDLKLQYYFGGHDIAFRQTEHGKEVLAAGLKEIGQLLRRLPYAQHRGIVIGQYPLW